jgi:hypothetical protein
VIAAPPPAPPVALAVSPSRLLLAAGETRTIEVANRGQAAATVVAAASGLAYGLRGRPRVLGRTAAVLVRPRRIAVPAGGAATVAVSAPGRSRPGDRPALVLLSTRGPARGVAVGLRVGVVVLVRGAGPVVRRLLPLGLRPRGRTLELSLRNAGNVAESLGPETVRVRLLRHGRVVGRPRTERRELLPHTRGICRLRLAGRLRDGTVAVVTVPGTTRRFRLAPAGRR